MAIWQTRGLRVNRCRVWLTARDAPCVKVVKFLSKQFFFIISSYKVKFLRLSKEIAAIKTPAILLNQIKVNE